MPLSSQKKVDEDDSKKKIRPGDVVFTQKSLTQQHQKDQCNINKIMAKYEQTGQIHHVNQRAAQYGDFSNVSDLISAYEQVEGANELFMQLPAETRAFFQNDPFKFVEYCSNPENIETLQEMGLAEPAPENVEQTTKKNNDEKPTQEVDKKD